MQANEQKYHLPSNISESMPHAGVKLQRVAKGITHRLLARRHPQPSPVASHPPYPRPHHSRSSTHAMLRLKSIECLPVKGCRATPAGPNSMLGSYTAEILGAVTIGRCTPRVGVFPLAQRPIIGFSPCWDHPNQMVDRRHSTRIDDRPLRPMGFSPVLPEQHRQRSSTPRL
jgi:hypothetical protein